MVDNNQEVRGVCGQGIVGRYLAPIAVSPRRSNVVFDEKVIEMPRRSRPVETTEEAIALEEAAGSVLRMFARGVVTKHVAPAALVMWGLSLMETVVSRKAISIWLKELSEKYNTPEK